MLLRFSTHAGAVSSWRLQKLLPGVLATIAGLAGVAGLAIAQPPKEPNATMPTPGLPGPVLAPQGSTSPNEKRVSVNFNKAPWPTVLDWFKDESGLIPVLTVQPTGSVTIVSPKDVKYTISEVVDVLNDAMMQQKFILIRRQVSFFIHPSDEKLDPILAPRIELSELASRGRTEIVQLLLPLKTLNVEDTAPEIKNLMSVFGSISTLTKSNTLVLTDTAGNIRRIYDMIQQIEQKTEDGETYTHKCLYKKAQEVADILKTHLAESTVTTPGAAPGAMPGFFPGGFGGPGGGPGGFDLSRFGITPGGPGGGVDPRGGDGVGGPGGRGPGGRGSAGAAARSTRTSATISVDAKANSVTVVGPPDKVQLAKTLIEKTDKGDKPFINGEPILRKFPVPPGTADAIARTLQAENPSLKILALPTTNEILALATEEEHKVLDNKIRFSSPAWSGGGNHDCHWTGVHRTRRNGSQTAEVFPGRRHR